MAIDWRVAGSLVSLRSQVNLFAPNRSKLSDGTVGDLAHSSRSSDHNPDDWDGPDPDTLDDNVVRAWDVTHDPAGGLDAHALADRLLAAQDKRLKYIISRGRIGSGPAGPQPGVWRTYNGTNKHNQHAHISVMPAALGDAAGPWAGVTPGDDTMPPEMQRLLVNLDRDLRADLLKKQGQLNFLVTLLTNLDRDLRADLDLKGDSLDAVLAQLAAVRALLPAAL